MFKLLKLFRRNKITSAEEYYTQAIQICEQFDRSTQKYTSK
uniref:Uncharacterized protein n=1 Tax=Bacillus phage Adastra TaxID=3143958 RepID=A0AAU8BD16_9CAUD